MLNASVRVIVLTFGLGATVTVSWVAVRGLSVFCGAGPLSDLSWLTIWALQMITGGLIGNAAARSEASPRPH